MQITGLSPAQFLDIVAKVSPQYGDNLRPEFGSQQSSTRFRARVVLESTGYQLYGKGKKLAPGQRYSGNALTGQRRINAVCWHAYRDVLMALFDQFPKARVATALAIYRGKDSFYDLFPATGDHNIGSMACPQYMPDLCECEE